VNDQPPQSQLPSAVATEEPPPQESKDDDKHGGVADSGNNAAADTSISEPAEEPTESDTVLTDAEDTQPIREVPPPSTSEKETSVIPEQLEPEKTSNTIPAASLSSSAEEQSDPVATVEVATGESGNVSEDVTNDKSNDDSTAAAAPPSVEVDANQQDDITTTEEVPDPTESDTVENSTNQGGDEMPIVEVISPSYPVTSSNETESTSPVDVAKDNTDAKKDHDNEEQDESHASLDPEVVLTEEKKKKKKKNKKKNKKKKSENTTTGEDHSEASGYSLNPKIDMHVSGLGMDSAPSIDDNPLYGSSKQQLLEDDEEEDSQGPEPDGLLFDAKEKE
jgi:hypothetical protein